MKALDEHFSLTHGEAALQQALFGFVPRGPFGLISSWGALEAQPAVVIPLHAEFLNRLIFRPFRNRKPRKTARKSRFVRTHRADEPPPCSHSNQGALLTKTKRKTKGTRKN
jgi:hypothetical protein